MNKSLKASLLVLVSLTACSSTGRQSSVAPSSIAESSLSSNEPTSSLISESSTKSSTNDSSSSVSSNIQSSSSNTSSSNPASSSNVDDESIEPEVLQTVTVEEALEIIKNLKPNTLTEQRYEITCYIKEITQPYDPLKNCMSFKVSTKMDSAQTLIAFNTSAENKIDFQEYTVGTKITLNGSLRKSGTDTDYMATIYSPTVYIVESLLVDATDLSIQDVTLVEGNKQELVIAWSPENARKQIIAWEIEDSTIASIDENNTVKGLKAGATTATATTSSFSKKINITVTAENTNKVEIKFDKFLGGDIPTTAMKAENVIDTVVGTGVNYLESCDEASNVFLQPLCLRLGNSQKPGSLTLTLKEAITVSKVIVSVKKYSSDVSKLSFSYDSIAEELPSLEATDKTQFEQLEFDINGQSIKTFKLSNDVKRMFIESISFVLA